MEITSFLPTMLNYLKNDYVEYMLVDQMVHITYKKGGSIDLKASVQIVQDRLKFQEGLSFPILCDIRNIREVSKPARDYLALEGSVLIKAVALIVEPPISEMLSIFYHKTSRPPIPSKSFEHVSEALFFLNEFL